jgi:hypothetical protein
MRLLKYLGVRPKLPLGMDGKEVMARYTESEARKRDWISHMEEAYRYSIPHRNTFYDQAKGQKKGHDVFDSTAVLGVPQFATKMQSVLLPPWREWSKLSTGPDVPAFQRDNARIAELLQEATDIFFGHVHHSNMATQVHESFQDLAVGTGAFDLMAGKLGQAALNFNAIPLPELVLEEGPQSTIETTYRDLQLSARLIGRQWPGAQLGSDLTKLVQDKPGTKVNFVEAVLYDPDRDMWSGACVWKEKKLTIWEAQWSTNPRIVFRWSVTPGEIYGRGPIMQVLADIKTANKVVEFILRNAAMIVSGMWTATTDSALNPYNFRPAPGAVIPVQSNDQRNPTIRALERSGDLRIGFEVLTQLQQTIKAALFQQLREPDDAVVSATQYATETKELVSQIGSSFGRLQTEVVEATVKRGTDILAQRGAMPNVRIDGRQVTLKHTSPLARAQDMDDLLTLQQTLETAGLAGPESVALGIKVEDLASWVAKKTGLDPRLIRDPAEREELKQKAAQMIAAAQQGGAKAAA